MTTLTDPALGKGPNDLLRFGNADDVIDIIATYDGLVGFNIYGGGGNDTITGSIADDTLEGGTGSDTIEGGDGSDMIYGGKANGAEGKDRETTSNFLYGEADTETIFANGTGFGDTIYGGDGAAGVGTTLVGNAIFGDYGDLTVNADVTYISGSDILVGGNAVRSFGAVNEIYGDAFDLDLLTALVEVDPGVFEFVGADFTGGDDDITGGTNSRNSLWGDVKTVNLAENASFTGGIDTITGGDGASAFNTMWGDAQTVNFDGNDATFTGGNDRLISGTGSTDIMYGDWADVNDSGTGNEADGGADTFVFGVGNGKDKIMDFEVGVDTVELTGFDPMVFNDFTDLAGLWTTEFGIFGQDLALDLDGTLDGFGDIIVFDDLAGGGEGALSGSFLFT